MDISHLLQHYADRVNQQLGKVLAAQDAPDYLKKAMQHAVLLGGKRVRPFLVYTTGQMLGMDLDTLDGPACAIELIHAYSLVHDDLPAMDDDELRRGHPTCHIAFDEATAILAGDALQSLAFEVLTTHPMPHTPLHQRLAMIRILAQGAGAAGMAGGQSLDLLATNQTLERAQLERVHQLKTGQLMIASVLMGAYAHPQVQPKHLELLQGFASHIGLAFQVQDDILDIESDTATLGKPQGSDIQNNKSTYPGLLGIEAAKLLAQDLYRMALDNLNALQAIQLDTQSLQAFAQFIIQRKY